jgi:hypothetical protein
LLNLKEIEANFAVNEKGLPGSAALHILPLPCFLASETEQTFFINGHLLHISISWETLCDHTGACANQRKLGTHHPRNPALWREFEARWRFATSGWRANQEQAGKPDRIGFVPQQ